MGQCEVDGEPMLCHWFPGNSSTPKFECAATEDYQEGSVASGPVEELDECDQCHDLPLPWLCNWNHDQCFTDDLLLAGIIAEVASLVFSLSSGVVGEITDPVSRLVDRVVETPNLTVDRSRGTLRLSRCGGQLIAAWRVPDAFMERAFGGDPLKPSHWKRTQVMTMLFLLAYGFFCGLLSQTWEDLPVRSADSFSLDRDSCLVEIRRRATLGGMGDPISVESTVDPFVAEIPWGGWVVTEAGNDVIEYGPDGQFNRTLGQRGEGPGELDRPWAVAVDPTDSTWISDRRGRAVLFGPDGLPGRTVLSPDLFQIEGFTESGFPYARLTKYSESSPTGEPTWGYIQTWSREGEPLVQLGPGGFAPDAQGLPSVSSRGRVQSVVVGDTLGILSVSWEAWLTYWSASREWASVPADSVWRTLGLEGSPETPSDGRPVAVSSDGAGGYWVLGAVRRLSESEEDDLIRRSEAPANMFYRGRSPPVRNAVYDGAILHVTAEGTITAATLFDEFPEGFASTSQFYTFTESEAGLIQVHIWEFKEDCPAAGMTRQD